MDNSEIKILLVDDDPVLRNMHEIILKESGYQVDTAENGQQAYDFLNTNTYNMLIADIFMPQITGIDIVLYCQQHFPSLKTILLSGGGKDLTAKHGKSSVTFKSQHVKIDLFLQKPFNTDEMLNLIEGFFQG